MADRVVQLSNAKDEAGIRQLIVAGQVYVAQGGEQVRILGQSIGRKEVRFIDGPLAEKSGWIAGEHAQ